MKKLLFVLVVILFSCEKDDTFCWKCYKDISRPGYYSSVMVEVCGLSDKEIGGFISDNTSTSGDIKITMRCEKNEK